MFKTKQETWPQVIQRQAEGSLSQLMVSCRGGTTSPVMQDKTFCLCPQHFWSESSKFILFRDARQKISDVLNGQRLFRSHTDFGPESIQINNKNNVVIRHGYWCPLHGAAVVSVLARTRPSLLLLLSLAIIRGKSIVRHIYYRKVYACVACILLWKGWRWQRVLPHTFPLGPRLPTSHSLRGF